MDTYGDQDKPIAVAVTDDMLHVTLADGRIIDTPLQWYPRLVAATPGQIANFYLSVSGIHWPDLDEDLSVDGMLNGKR